MPEISEADLLQNSKLRELVQGLAKNPRTARQFAQLVKSHDPSLDIKEPPPDPAEERFAKLEQELAAEKKAREEDRVKREQDGKLDGIRSKQEREFAQLKGEKWTEDGLKAVQELMESEGILSPLIAASHIEKLHPPAAPVGPSASGGWNFFESVADGDADLKKLIETKGESVPLIDKMVRDTLTDIRGPQRR